jgi:SAM-dependent methyltransferase
VDQHFWDERYKEQGFAYGTEPNVFLQSLAARFKPGQRALLVCDGEGRNGVWLAEQGLEVTSVDYSQVGLEKAQQLAREKGTCIETVCADIYSWDWPVAEYDHVILIYAHFRDEHRARIHQHALETLKPGGTLILEAYTREQLDYDSGGPRDINMLYTQEMLETDFSRARIHQLETLIAMLNEGKYHVGDAAIIRLIAQP